MRSKLDRNAKCQYSGKRTQGKEVILTRYCIDYIKQCGYLVVGSPLLDVKKI